MPTNNIVVIGASAGGIGLASAILSKFPKTIPAAICVVAPTSPEGPGMLATELNRSIRPDRRHPGRGDGDTRGVRLRRTS